MNTMHHNLTTVREVLVGYGRPKEIRPSITCATDAAAIIESVLPDNSREHFVTLFLDGGHKVCAFSVTATGNANTCPVHAREVFQPAILVGAVALIVGHNHPSGDRS